VDQISLKRDEQPGERLTEPNLLASDAPTIE
jgi:hypothetical protein